MRRAPTAALRLVVLVLALSSTLGYKCGGAGSGGNPVPVALVSETSTVGVQSPLTVEIAVNADLPIQAFEVALRWDPEMLRATLVAPHSEFDDDGALFTSPHIDLAAGSRERRAFSRSRPSTSRPFRRPEPPASN